MKLLLLNDNRAHPNWGAQATPHAIDMLLGDGIPGCEKTWLSWDWLRSRHRTLKWPFPSWAYDPNVVRWGRRFLIRASRYIERFPAVADDFDRVADEWMKGKGGPMAARFTEEVRRADIVVYNGENSLYANTVEGRRALFLMWLVGVHMKTPACIVNHTVHLTGVQPIMNAMVRKVHPRMDLLTCREAASHRLLQEMGIGNAQLVPDVVFYLEERNEAATQIDRWLGANELESGKFVCMSASGLPVSRPRGDWDGEYAGLVRVVQERTDLRVVLMARDPHCQFLSEVAHRTGSVFFGAEHHFSELWPLLRQSAALVTGHFHYAIIASIGGCPFVPLSANNHKMRGVCELLDWVLSEPYDITDLASCGEEIVDRLVELIASREQLSNQLSRRARELREQVGTLPGRIADLVGYNADV